ncbi:MAG: hypothetical protein ABGW78_15290, partial [Pirellulales bacterium]
MIPEDVAFVSSTLRLREQYEALISSNAFAAIKKLPGVKKFFDSLEQQNATPGNPLSIANAMRQIPENKQALDLLVDMVATETFLYGDKSWAKLAVLLRKLQQTQQAANIASISQSGIQGEVSDILAEMVFETLAENKDLIVLPDLVWGFRTTMKDAAVTQMKRLETGLQSLTMMDPSLADAVERRTIAGGEFITFTYKPDYASLRQRLEGGDSEAADNVDIIFGALQDTEIVVAIGVVDDHVLLSIGDSTSHLEQLVISDGGFSKGLFGTAPLKPLKSDREKDITAVSYMSQEMAEALGASKKDVDQLIDLVEGLSSKLDLSEQAAAEARAMMSSVAEKYEEWMPVPGPWMSYSFLSAEGYEGYVWDWSQNKPLDGSKRLDLLEHVGGSPLAAIVFRVKDTYSFDDLITWADMAREFSLKNIVPKMGGDAEKQAAKFTKHILPLGQKFVDIMRRTFRPAMKGGQAGFVLDGKSTVSKLSTLLPKSDKPLPLLEPSIVFGIENAELFREGMNDLFALSDELVDAVREMNPDAVPDDYRIAEPITKDVQGGTIWSWSIEKSGLDSQIQPSIALGKDVAVLTLVPRQAERLVVKSPLETGSQLSKFEEPLSAAAALNVSGLIDFLQPWVVYWARYAAVMQRDGLADPESTLEENSNDGQVNEILDQVLAVLDAAKSLQVAVAEMH